MPPNRFMAFLPKTYSGSVLVMRMSAMGDVVMTVPVVARLRESYPNVRIVVLTPPFFTPFFRGIERVEFVMPEFRERHKGICGVFRLSADLGRFDKVADLHDVLRSKMLRRVLRLKGTEVAYIDKGRKEKKALVDLKNKRLVPLKTTVERYRDVFLKLGFDLPEIRPPARVRYEMSAETAALSGGKNGPWIGISPFAQHEGKIYPEEKMERVIAVLSRIPDVRIFIFGGGDHERAYGERMAGSYASVVSAIGRVKLEQEMELISNLDVMVSMDSSGMHMASLVGVPVVSVWGATHPYAGFYGLGQDPANAVQLELACRPCSIYGNKPCVFGDYRCMKNIEPERVAAEVCGALGVAMPV